MLNIELWAYIKASTLALNHTLSLPLYLFVCFGTVPSNTLVLLLALHSGILLRETIWVAMY